MTRLIISMGDPAGIGAEVILKALFDRPTTDITIAGNRAYLNELYDRLRSDSNLANPNDLNVLDLDLPGEITLSKESAISGEASFRYLETAIDRTLAGEFDGIVTAPIAKSAWKAAGHIYPGQTELLAEKAGIDRFGMMFVARSPHTDWTLRALLATTHIPLKQVPEALTFDGLTQKLELLIECLEEAFGIDQPRIAIAGLNPHSGEQGQLGREEIDWLSPWLESMRKQFPHVQLDGLLPPDTMWVKPGQAWFGSGRGSAHDAYLALYHDQGLIPVKLMAFDRAVNTSIGLPFVRTSPDHGTAFDIAGKGIADATSMKAAIDFAIELVQRRSSFLPIKAI
ncbi:4-hydroxythreonine-4-phosphate dehydrogenase PdxA [Leptolyngbya sp. NIES-2104]|uniref:4-hydroxythreonine-4-phosphate dehydrogenase PdxA n=1 Tax=Leptolyngbya sp. NIES-2104 TaxID=1552121 RepID=UPI0006ECC8E6|nr:4-hydroxythreonine-4-phosphate dehydrogenase PdxA [Leptolyngbya sp. NIES-2104]GAP96509.1 4-hydroxythreonine-4-phosphate dehydrogenase [Leptolyngbya sp. NIES-2104]